MKILVTGGLGFIGSNFVRYLIQHHPTYQIINLDKLTYAANPANLRDIPSKAPYRFFHGDIRDESLLKKLLSRVEAVVNFAAETHVDRSIHRADEFLRTNIEGTYVLLKTAQKLGIKRFLHISTDEVYGSCSRGSFAEDTPLQPNSPYAVSKAAADLLIRSFRITYDYPVIVARPSNNFGPYQFPEKFIPLFITNALDNQPLPLYGKGTNIRDWLYVEDNCRALDLLLRRGRPGEIYNIAGGQELSNIKVAKTILRLLNKSDSLIKSVPDRPGHDWRYSLDGRKLRRELGWRPLYSFRQALSITLHWYQDNCSWWEEIKKRRASFRSYYREQYQRRR